MIIHYFKQVKKQVVLVVLTNQLCIAFGECKTSNWHQAKITPVLASLDWLPVNFRIDYKILV